jgi:hypothetical protein
LTFDDLNECQKRAVEKWQKTNDHEYDNQDNHRVAIVGDEASLKEYARLEAKGCCGSCDEEIECDDGTVLMYGFNYGH